MSWRLILGSWVSLVSAVVASCASSPGQTANAPSATAVEEDAGPAPAEPEPEDSARVTYENPIISGTSPDPSICRVGEDYYLVVSSFEYFPGVPIYHSRDLVHFRQIGNVLTRKSQLNLDGIKSSHGVFAPTIRYHEGTFYMVTTNMAGGGSFYVTAKDPAGPWSDPIWVKEDVFTMDPSLFFDDDGKAYYTRHGEQRHGAIFQAPIDIESGKLLEQPVKVWDGTGGIWPEGPHLYKVDGKYYLLISEGGTSYDHMITVARADSPMGPFVPHEQNPLLTHKDLPDHPIQAMGHADLVQTPEGDWWMVLLGIRPSTPRHHHIGRETFLAPVTWADGWPVINGGMPLELSMTSTALPPARPVVPEPHRDEFAGPELGLAWRYVRNPDESKYSLGARPGFLRLTGTSASMDDLRSPTLVVQPQTDLRMEASTEVDPTVAPGQMAGLVVRGNEDNHYQLVVEGTKQGREVVLRIRIAGQTQEVGRRSLAPGPVQLFVRGELDRYVFSFSQGGGARIELGSGPTTSFAYEKTQSFTGAFVGLFAYSKSAQPSFHADFAWFEMRPLDGAR